MNKHLAVIILAAGKGVRMKSQLPKVLHPIAGRPMLGYTLDLARSLKPKLEICVLGHQSRIVRDYIEKEKGKVKIVIQKKLLGSADAVKQTRSILRHFRGTVLLLYADNPLVKPQTIKNLIRYHQQAHAAGTLLVATLDKPKGYGRIIRNSAYDILRIVEEIDAKEHEKDSKEINTGICCYNKERLFSMVFGFFTLLNIILNYILIIRFGFMGACYATIFATGLGFIFYTYYIHRHLSIAFEGVKHGKEKGKD